MHLHSKEEIIHKVQQLNARQPWWHDIELPYGIKTIGREESKLSINHNQIKWKLIKPYFNAKDKTVLDLGCNEGFFSVEIHKQHPKKIFAVDINKDRVEKARFVFDVMGLTSIKLHQLDVFDISFSKTIPHVDIVLALGILHRIPNPYGFLEILTHLGDELFIEWSAFVSPRPLMAFWSKEVKSEDIHNTGFFQPTVVCVEKVLKRFGFLYNTRIQQFPRAILHSTRKKEYALPAKGYRPNRLLALKQITRNYFKDILDIIRE